MKLFINTGGKGLRLKHLTHDIPKPMLEVAGRPVLEHLVLWAKDNGITEIVMLNGYLHNCIEDHFGDGSKFGVSICHSNETEPLGSGGAVKYASQYANERFVLISGDVICKVDLARMLDCHEKAGDAVLTLLLHETNHPEDSDIMQIDDDGRIVKFISKKDDHSGAGNLGNAGLFIIEPKVMTYMAEDVFTLETYLIPRLLEAGEHLNAYVSEEYIRDMGTPDRLKKVEDELENE